VWELDGRPPIITLLSDFGLRDPYVAEMKAVILTICPRAVIVDISHGVRRHDIRMGTYILYRATRYFPKGTIHVAVVDPGVGTKRKPIVIETKRSTYVGPDNGLLALPAGKEGILHVYEIRNPKYILREVSRTFHGRDIFSCAAAHIANGVPPSKLGPELSDFVKPIFAKPRVIDGERIIGEIIYIDGFGNLVTDVSPSELTLLGIEEGDEAKVVIGGRTLKLRLCAAYGDVPAGSPLLIFGSAGLLEVSINMGDAARSLNVKVGDRVVLEPLYKS